jgi:2-amino-4-hydroxy-6-hydroxymethyldihydropteridine diphosphokinase
MARALIGLGANLGDRQQTLDEAARRLAMLPGSRLLAQSRWSVTRPVGGPPGQADFLNGAALVETSLGPHALLAALGEIEAAAGRRRFRRWEARPLDLDLLLFDELMLLAPEIEIPHPGLAFRRFVLEPAAEVAGDLLHPRIGWTIGQLLDHLNSAPHYAATLGADQAAAQQFAQRLAQASGAALLAGSADRSIAGSPIRSAEQGIELAERWRAVLDPVGSTAGSAAGAFVSDFWWGEFPIRVAGLAPIDEERALRAWRERASGVPTPKLLLVLGPVDAVSPAGVDPPAESLAPAAPGWPGHGPFLRVDYASAPDDALNEAAAALDAMR